MKRSYFEKQKQRIRQKVTLLTANPNFQKDILILREKWHIPENGFSYSAEKDQRWNAKLLESTGNYYKFEWPKFRKKILELKKQGKIKDAETEEGNFNERAPLNEFNNDISKLICKHKIPPKWDNFIKQYLLFNSIRSINILLGTRIQTTWNEETKKKQISLLIDDNTTLEDIKFIWPTVKILQSSLSYKKQKKFQPIKKFNRDKQAYELKQSGKTLEQIAGIMSKKFNKEYMWTDVASFIKRHKQKLGIN